MGVFRQNALPIRSARNPEVSMEPISDDFHETMVDQEDDLEEVQSSLTNNAVKRKFPLIDDCQHDDTEDEDDTVVMVKPSRSNKPFALAPKTPQQSVQSSQQRARISADIDPELRRRAKIYAMLQDKPFCMILEDWIREHCLEP